MKNISKLLELKKMFNMNKEFENLQNNIECKFNFNNERINNLENIIINQQDILDRISFKLSYLYFVVFALFTILYLDLF